MKKFFMGGIITATVMVVAGVIFYACNKESEQKTADNGILIQKQIGGYGDGTGTGTAAGDTSTKAQKKECICPDESKSYKCDLGTYNVYDACTTGHACICPPKINTLMVSYVGSTIVIHDEPTLYVPNCLRITAEVLMGNETHKPIVPLWGKFDIINCNIADGIEVKTSWEMQIILKNDALNNLVTAIQTGNVDMQKMIVKNFNNYKIYVGDVLLTPTFVKIIHVDGEQFVVNYNHIRNEIWQYLVNILD